MFLEIIPLEKKPIIIIIAIHNTKSLSGKKGWFGTEILLKHNMLL